MHRIYDQSLEVLVKVSYLGDTIGDTRGVVNRILATVRNGGSQFQDL